MEFKLTSRERVVIPYSPNIPPAFSRYAIPAARGYHASGDFGVLLFFEIDCVGFRIWHNQYFIRQTAWLQGAMDQPLLALHVVLRGHFRYHPEGIDEVRFPEGHFNLVYAPVLKTRALFESDKEYMTFTLQFTPAYLESFKPHFPLLADFLKNADKNVASLFNSLPVRATPDMIMIIRDILDNDFAEDVKKIYVQHKVTELLLLAFARITPAFSNVADIRLHQYDIDKIREAREYLLLNMEHPLTVIELSHKVGINDFKLKKGFKQLYGVTIFDFLLEARMEKARKLLSETNTPVHEVAFATGYKNVSSFTAAFKKKVGYPPSALKRAR